MLSRSLAALSAALVLGLAGCGEEAGTVADDEPFNDADIAFANDMIPHHAEALAMVDLTTRREVSPELATLADQIRTAQTTEIETMADWLDKWDQPVPQTVRDHANADDHGGMDGMEGMVDLAALEAASDADFEALWLEAMIAHHEGAVEMAEVELDEGEAAEATDLAVQIVDSQQAEIEQMESLLGS